MGGVGGAELSGLDYEGNETGDEGKKGDRITEEAAIWKECHLYEDGW